MIASIDLSVRLSVGKITEGISMNGFWLTLQNRPNMIQGIVVKKMGVLQITTLFEEYSFYFIFMGWSCVVRGCQQYYEKTYGRISVKCSGGIQNVAVHDHLIDAAFLMALTRLFHSSQSRRGGGLSSRCASCFEYIFGADDIVQNGRWDITRYLGISSSDYWLTVHDNVSK